jgi:predicted small secreted protein
MRYPTRRLDLLLHLVYLEGLRKPGGLCRVGLFAAVVIAVHRGDRCWAFRLRGENMMRKMSLARTAVVLGCLVAIFLSGCATTRGIGQDTQSLGRSIEKSGK